MTPSGIEPAAFGFVARHFNHCATAHYGPGVDSNEYQEYFSWGRGSLKAAGALG